MSQRLRFDGYIAGAAFASGDRFVAGCWQHTPFGSFADLMWARPDGTRILLGADPSALEFIAAHYEFEEVRRVKIEAHIRPRQVTIKADDIQLSLSLRPPGIASWALSLRPGILGDSARWLDIEDRWLRPLAGPILGDVRHTRTTGLTRADAREWYTIRDVRFGNRVSAAIGGQDLGDVDLNPLPAKFGFSEVLPRPGIVRVTSRFELP